MSYPVLAFGRWQPLGQIGGRGVNESVVVGNTEIERPACRRPQPTGCICPDDSHAWLGPVAIQHPLVEPHLGGARIAAEHLEI